MSIPFFIVKKGTSRGAKHGKSQEQHDHFKANESLRHAKQEQYSSILLRFQEDELYLKAQIAIGWTEEHCKYLDSLLLEDKSYTATRRERVRYESNWTLGSNGQGPMPGPVKKREDYPQAVTRVQVMRQQAEKPGYPHIPHNRRFRRRPIEQWQKAEEKQKAEWKQWRWKAWTSTPSWSSRTSSSTDWQGSSTWIVKKLHVFRLQAMAIPL